MNALLQKVVYVRRDTPHEFTMSAADVIGEEQAWVMAMPEPLRGVAQSVNKAAVEPILNK